MPNRTTAWTRKSLLEILLSLAILLGAAWPSSAAPVLPQGPVRIHLYPGNELGGVEGLVFQDWDQDGERDAEEPTLAGATLILYDAEGEMVARQETVGDGRYAFTALWPGQYTLVEIDPFGYSTLTSNEFDLDIKAGARVEVEFGDVLLLCAAPIAEHTLLPSKR